MHLSYCVVADVGGTHIRIGYFLRGAATLQGVAVFQCADFEHIDAAIDTYLRKALPTSLNAVDPSQGCEALCLAIPGAIDQPVIRLVNNPWIIDRDHLAARFDCPILLLNDFSAQAYCLQSLNNEELLWWREPQFSVDDKTRLVIGPGTGLGVAALLPSGAVVESEGGHIGFAPTTDLQIEILCCLQQQYPRVSVERLVSGPGLANLYRALVLLQDDDVEAAQFLPSVSPPAITAGARQGDALCLQTVAEFTTIFGSVCGDLALTMGATGGVYLSGGVLNQLGDLFDQQLFFAAFQHKGRFTDYCSDIPVAKINTEYPGLIGAVNFANNHL